MGMQTSPTPSIRRCGTLVAQSTGEDTDLPSQGFSMLVTRLGGIFVFAIERFKMMNKIIKIIAIVLFALVAANVLFGIVLHTNVFGAVPALTPSFIAFAFVVLFIFSDDPRKKANSDGENDGREDEIVASILENDGFFSKEEFKAHAVTVLGAVHKSISARDITHAEQYINTSYSRTLASAIALHKKKHKTVHYDNTSVCGVRIVDYYISKNTEFLTVIIDERLNEYTTDDATGNIISGSESEEVKKSYKLTFTKNCDSDATNDTTHCPNCGAYIGQSGGDKCEYCYSRLHTTKNDRLLSSYGLAGK